MQITVSRHSFLNRSNVYTLLLVALLFAILPLSQRLGVSPPDDSIMLRAVDVLPPPPPPPRIQSNLETGATSRAGLNIESIQSSVELNPIVTGVSLDSSDALDLGAMSAQLDIQPQANFKMEGIGFGTAGLDRPPIMIVRPVLRSGYLRDEGISEFDVVVMVKWLEDGSLSFIGIEEIEYPDERLAALTRDAVGRIRYSRPTVNGEPVERFIRLPLTIFSR